MNTTKYFKLVSTISSLEIYIKIDEWNGENIIHYPCCTLYNGTIVYNILCEHNTYKKVFDQVKLYAVQTNDVYEIQNLILVGIKGNPKVNTEKFDFYSDLLDTEIKNYQSDKRIVTDDFVPIGI